MTSSAAKPYGIHATAVLRSLYRRAEALETMQIMVEEDMANSADDYDQYDRAAAKCDAISDELFDINEQIAELEALEG